MANIASTWRALSGQSHWQGLLSPTVDIALRRYIIHYGEMAEVTYDAFIKEKASKYAGLPRYSMQNLFPKVALEKNNPYKYNVTKYLYATSGVSLPFPDILLSSLSREAYSKESNWIGYVAVASDEATSLLGRRDIVIAWRGTMKPLEWVNDFQFAPVPLSNLIGKNAAEGGIVHSGFYSVYTSTSSRSTFNKTTSARDQVLSEVRKLVDQYKDEQISITVTGHSLGAALATLCAVDLVGNKYNIPTSQLDKPCPVTAMVFASPRVGDANFKKAFSKYDQLRCLRVQNAIDLVPTQPLIGYTHVGELLTIDTTKSPYLKPSQDPSAWHNLEVYLHGVAGTQNKGGFKLVVDRDIALANKGGDMLKDEYLVPHSWWVEQNKGMVQQDNGTWKLMDGKIDELLLADLAQDQAAI